MVGQFKTNRPIVVSAPANAFALAETRDGGLAPLEVLDWRRSG